MRADVSRSIAALCLFLAASPVASQTVERGQAAADRPRPYYDPHGYNLSSFKIYPSVTTSTDASDNFRASSVDRQGDVYLTIKPAIALASDWDRNRLVGNAYFDQSIHANLTQENTIQYGASVTGDLDFTHDTQLRIALSAKHQVENRSGLGSFQGTITPIKYDTYHAQLSTSHAVNEIKLNGSLEIDYNNFQAAQDASGIIVDQDFRDVRLFKASGNVIYDFRSGIGILFSVRFDAGNFPFGRGSAGFDPNIDLNRNYNSYAALGGVSLELSSLVFGTIQVGYLNYEYTDPSLKDVHGFSYNADLLWNVTPLTSVRLQAARSVDPTSSTANAGNTRNDLTLAVDHELFRNIIILLDTRYTTYSPNGPGVGGQEFATGLGARYLIDRHWSINGRVRYAQRMSADIRTKYHASYGDLSIKYAF
jgi:hypothetical protein